MAPAKPQIQSANLESQTLFYRSWSVKAYTLLLLVPILYPYPQQRNHRQSTGRPEWQKTRRSGNSIRSFP